MPFLSEGGPGQIAPPPCLSEHRVGGLDVSRDAVSRLQQEQNLLFESILLGLGGRDLVEQCREFLIGLDGRLVSLEARQATVDLRHLFLQLPARVLVLSEPYLRSFHSRRRLGHAFLNLPFCCRHIGQPALHDFGGGVELLQGDER